MLKLLSKSLVLGLSMILLIPALEANPPLSDQEILRMAVCSSCGHSHAPKPFLPARKPTAWSRYNPFRLTLGGMMYVYQNIISPQLPAECLYNESCSDFSKNLIDTYGILPGVIYTSDRLMRCNRISAQDVHPLHIDESTRRIAESVDLYKKSGE